MINLVPTCVKCGSPVTDLLEAEVEEQGQLKRGKYVNSVWMCNECADVQKRESKNDQRESMVGVASQLMFLPILQRLMKLIYSDMVAL